MNRIDPWNDNINLINIFKNTSRKELFIYGPTNKNGKRIYINFIFYKNNNIINISSNEFDFDSRVNVDLNDNSAKINYIETFKKNGKEFYSGTDVMKLLLKILKNLNIIKVSLIDQSQITCKNRINDPKFLFSNSISYAIITLLKNNKTLYMKFGFKPYLNNKNKSSNIIDIIDNLKTITWQNIIDIIENGELTIKHIMNNKNNISNLDIKNIDTWIKYWKIIQKSFNFLYVRFKDLSNGPFDAFKHYNSAECQMFINWLELYSLSRYYEKTSYNFYIKNGTKHTFIIPYKSEFINLLNLLKNVEWIIENLQTTTCNININSHNKL